MSHQHAREYEHSLASAAADRLYGTIVSDLKACVSGGYQPTTSDARKVVALAVSCGRDSAAFEKRGEAPRSSAFMHGTCQPHTSAFFRPQEVQDVSLPLLCILCNVCHCHAAGYVLLGAADWLPSPPLHLTSPARHAAAADIGLKADKGKLATVHGTILKRVEEHAASAKMQGSMAGFSGGAREQLQGGGIAKGGLIKVTGDKPVFKKPEQKTSMLGLQALAAKKRAEEGRSALCLQPTHLRQPRRTRRAQTASRDAIVLVLDEPSLRRPEPKKAKLSFGDGGDEDKEEQQGGEGGGAKLAGIKAKPQYRNRAPDTPSHHGGVDREAAERIEERNKR